MMTKEECRDYLKDDKDEHRYKYPKELDTVLEDVHGCIGRNKGKNRYWEFGGDKIVDTFIQFNGYDNQKGDSYYNHHVKNLTKLRIDAKLRWDSDAKKIITIEPESRRYDFYRTMLLDSMEFIDVFVSVVTEEVKAMVECPRPNVKEWK